MPSAYRSAPDAGFMAFPSRESLCAVVLKDNKKSIELAVR